MKVSNHSTDLMGAKKGDKSRKKNTDQVIAKGARMGELKKKKKGIK